MTKRRPRTARQRGEDAGRLVAELVALLVDGVRAIWTRVKPNRRP